MKISPIFGTLFYETSQIRVSAAFYFSLFVKEVYPTWSSSMILQTLTPQFKFKTMEMKLCLGTIIVSNLTSKHIIGNVSSETFRTKRQIKIVVQYCTIQLSIEST